MKAFILVMIIAANMIAGSAYAKKQDSFRCGNRIIEVGMTTADLRKLCSRNWVPSEIRTDIKHYKTPKDIRHFVKSLPPTANTYQQWVYRESGKFNTWVYITDGHIRRIELGDRH